MAKVKKFRYLEVGLYVFIALLASIIPVFIHSQMDRGWDLVCIEWEYRLMRIKFSDVKYIESMREYVRFHLVDGTTVMTLLSLKSVEERLPKDIFMRIHRSFIVNLEKIAIIERQCIVFDKKTYIPIGDLYKDAFDNYVKEHFL